MDFVVEFFIKIKKKNEHNIEKEANLSKMKLFI